VIFGGRLSKAKAFNFRTKHPTIQSHIQSGSLSYETLTQCLYRIVKYENDKDKMLNAIVAINPEAVNEARER
jgi:amidase